MCASKHAIMSCVTRAHALAFTSSDLLVVERVAAAGGSSNERPRRRRRQSSEHITIYCHTHFSETGMTWAQMAKRQTQLAQQRALNISLCCASVCIIVLSDNLFSAAYKNHTATGLLWDSRKSEFRVSWRIYCVRIGFSLCRRRRLISGAHLNFQLFHGDVFKVSVMCMSFLRSQCFLSFASFFFS